MTQWHRRFGRSARTFCAALLAIGALTAVQLGDRAAPVDAAEVVSEFGGRPAFSPDSQRLAFVDRSYGNAFEMDLATRRIRNLTGNIPHHGIVRIQYLPDGNYLVTAPRLAAGRNTRAHLEMWVLDRDLAKGLQPLGEQVFEGIAVSRRRNLIAWTVIEPELAPDDPWHVGFMRPTKRYMAEIAYRDRTPVLTNKREVMTALPKDCQFIEPQDFRADDGELVYSCMSVDADRHISVSVMGTSLPNGRSQAYFRRSGEYAEAEGIAPSGDWTTVECGKQSGATLPPLDICRLELKPGGAFSPLVRATQPGGTIGVSNPVISPDGRWLAFQRSDSNDPDIGAGAGIYLMPVPGN